MMHGREAAMQVDGQCHCGRIRYEAELDPAGILLCHCTDCQATSGSAFRTVALTVPGGYRLLAGTPTTYVKTAESGARRVQTFCPDCGSPLTSTSEGPEPKVHSLRTGTCRQRAQLRPVGQIWCGSALPWLDTLGAIPRRAKG
ncbi:GFA family protein [Falsiroseomonas oryziterrae]|uniref:GFA family protein n=1 Tax=Falsiroseomonas oryziterrae TaxID=2911368 RepID=UPI001F492AE1|nr:GFA family protein [Roseomonas sp. NPKOSM-4]